MLRDVARRVERAYANRVADAARLPPGVPGALSDGDLFWAQAANSIRRNLSGEARDAGMGANFLWLATRQYAGRKLILWAHNNHLVTEKWMVLDGPDSTGMPRTDAARARTTYLGDEVRRAFGRQAVAIATTVYDGHYSPAIQSALGERGPWSATGLDSTAVLAPAAPGTLEAALAQAGHRIALVDLRPFAGLPAVPTRALDYSTLPPLRLALWRGYDAILFVRTTFGLNDDVAARSALGR